MDFWHCFSCDFIFKDPKCFLTPAQEKARYDLHKNGDEGHQRFLTPVVETVVDSLPLGSIGLDWGSGPEPILAQLLRDRGYEMTTYDLYYQPEKPSSERRFDFITLTEVIEHLQEPHRDLQEIATSLRHRGILVVMTELHRGEEALGPWYYRKDPTHVGFFNERCFQKFSELFGLKLQKLEGRVALFEKA